MSSKIEADVIHQMAFEEGQPADNGDGYNFTAEEFDLFVERLLTSTAPVVERQPAVLAYRIDECARMIEDPEPDEDSWVKWEEYRVELAELQATIARQAAEIERLRQLPTRNALIKERERLKDEIERLKGGQGEAVAVVVSSSWNSETGSSCVIQAIMPTVLDSGTKLYTSQPAKVSVGWIYEDGKEFTRCADHAHDLMAEGIELTPVFACLDKVKELNQ